jgi:helicase MOV-10
MPRICPRLRIDGFCDDPSCRYKHNAWPCQTCQLIFHSQLMFDSHMSSRRHRNAVEGKNVAHHCTLCNLAVFGVESWQMHLNGKRHLKAIRAAEPTAAAVLAATQSEPEQTNEIPGYHFCSVCNTQILDRLWARHPSHPLHIRKEQYQRYQTAFDEASKDKHGITIAGNSIDFEVLEHEEAVDGKKMTFSIENTVPSTKITVTSVKLSPGLHSRNQSWYIIPWSFYQRHTYLKY